MSFDIPPVTWRLIQTDNVAGTKTYETNDGVKITVPVGSSDNFNITRNTTGQLIFDGFNGATIKGSSNCCDYFVFKNSRNNIINVSDTYTLYVSDTVEFCGDNNSDNLVKVDNRDSIRDNYQDVSNGTFYRQPPSDK